MRQVGLRKLGLIAALLVIASMLPLNVGRVAHADSPSSSGKRIVGYFVEWGVYGRQYFVKNIVTSGTASKLTVIDYAFGAVMSNTCQLADPWADYQMPYSAANSVDGTADSSDPNALRGSFHQLQELKALHPNIKVMISLGGFTGSAGFTKAAEPANVKGFVSSCISAFITDPRWAGLFDGIDIDWEYPAACGLTCGVPEDTRNYTDMLAEFRKQLDGVRPGLLLTVATPAGPAKYSQIELNKVQNYVDWMNLLTYDLHGTWESVTNHAAPLYYSPQDPTKSGFSVDNTVRAYLNAGVSPDKIVVGIPFYGHGWTGVPNVDHGLYQASTGAAAGTYEAGSEDYKVLKTYAAGSAYDKYFDPLTQATWIYSPSLGEFWSYDDPTTVSIKGKYIVSNGLAGAMFWSMDGDDANGSLVTALYNSLQPIVTPPTTTPELGSGELLAVGLVPLGLALLFRRRRARRVRKA